VLLLQWIAIGYSAMGRSFAYIGLAPAKLFIGELVLACALVARRDALEAALLDRPFSRIAAWVRLTLVVFGVYGVVTLVRGLAQSHPTMEALQTFAFNYYTIYLLLGIWAATRDPQLLPRLAVLLAWVHGIYGVLYVAVLNRLGVPFPGGGGAGVMLFGQPAGSALSILLLLCFERNLRRAIVPLLLNLVTLLAVQVRSEWVGFAAAVILWAVLAGQVKRFAVLALAAFVLLSAATLLDLRIPGIAGRGGEVSVRGVVGRLVASVSADLGARFVDDADSLRGTVTWRKQWWAEIWEDNQRGSDATFFLGHGYGFELRRLVTYVEEGTRTPHNVWLFALGYGGWVGMLTFAAFQLSLLGAAIWVWRRGGGAFGVCYWVLCVLIGSFGNLFETPFGAMPYYFLIGAAIAPAFGAALLTASTSDPSTGPVPSSRLNPRA
jgi:hypothetical protein